MIEDVHIRHLQADDTQAVVSLYAAAATRDPTIGPITQKQWTSFLERPNTAGGRDFRIALLRGRVAGLAESSLRHQTSRRVRFFKLIVEPVSRRMGIGTALLRELLTLDETDASLHFQSLAAADWSDGIAFLEKLGFSHIESELRMRCVSLSAIASLPPARFSIERALKPAALAHDVTLIHNSAFEADIAFRRYTVSEMAKILAEDGQCLWIARSGSDIVGYCLLEIEPHLVWVQQLAIRPDAQRQGLGMGLAHQALLAQNVSQSRPAELNASSVNEGAVELYGKLGFAKTREIRRYGISQKQLEAALR